jgi:hypothetical protein
MAGGTARSPDITLGFRFDVFSFKRMGFLMMYLGGGIVLVMCSMLSMSKTGE